MAWLDVTPELLILHLSLFERLGGYVRGDAHVPLASVRGARAVADPWPELRGVRRPGLGIPGRIALGTRRFAGGKDFVAVYRKGPAVIVDLTGVEFSRLVVSTRNAAEVAAEVDRAARGRRPV